MVHRHDWRYIHYFFEQLQWITYMQGQYSTKKRSRLKRRITLDSEINSVTNRYATYPSTSHLGHVSIKPRYLSLECKEQFECRFLLLSCFRNVLFGNCNRCSNQRKQRLSYFDMLRWSCKVLSWLTHSLFQGVVVFESMMDNIAHRSTADIHGNGTLLNVKLKGRIFKHIDIYIQIHITHSKHEWFLFCWNENYTKADIAELVFQQPLAFINRLIIRVVHE